MPTLNFDDEVMNSLGAKLDQFAATLDADEQNHLGAVIAAGWAHVDEVRGLSWEEPEVEGFQMGSMGEIFKLGPASAPTGGGPSDNCVSRCMTSPGTTLMQCLYWCRNR